MELHVWFICVVSLVSASEYDYNYNYYRDEYNNDAFTIHGEYRQDWNHQDWGRVPMPKCIDIPDNLTLCNNIGYESMRLPNLLGHDTLSEVTQQARSWVPLLNIHCHPDAKLFLCSLFSPVCLERTIWPCRSLCESVKGACLPRMKYYKFDWPDMLLCNKFPIDNDLCIKQQTLNKSACNGTQCKIDGNSSGGLIADNNCTACKHPMTYEAIVDNYCRSQFVIRTSVSEVQEVVTNSVIVLKKKKKFYKKDGVITKKDKKDMAFVIKGGVNCQCDLVNDTKSKFLMMGNRTGNDFVLTFVVPWEKKNKDFKRALKKIKKGHKCSELFKDEVIGVSTELPTEAGTVKPSKGNRNKKGKNRKGGKRGKGKNKGKKKKKKKGKRNRKDKKNKKKGKRRRPKKDRKRKGGSNVTPGP